jgi:5-methyltetrahydrofolate--homocysteine methyltransferase
MIIYDPEDRTKEIVRFDFPRQGKPPYWCLSDFFRRSTSGEYDVVAFMIVTMGRRASEIARKWFAEDRYVDYLRLHGLGVEAAEALAEYLHRQIRMELGIAGQDARERQRIFQQKYQGSRYSFGYPACPRLEDQVKIWPLLDPERIGVTLSEEFQLDPEQSTTALITHHPEAKYFNVR